MRRMRAATVGVLVLALALGGCREPVAPTPAPADPSPPDMATGSPEVVGSAATPLPSASAPEPAPLRVQLDDDSYVLAVGGAMIASDGDVMVELRSGEDPVHAVGVSFNLEAGPGRGHFVGHPIGVPLSGLNAMFVPRGTTLLTIRPFEAKMGEHVRGVLSFATEAEGRRFRGEGSFDVVIEQDFSGGELPPAPPANLPSGPLSGQVDGKPFPVGSAVAIVWETHDERARPYLGEIYFYDKSGVGCDDFRQQERSIYLELDVADESGYRRGPQPARLGWSNRGPQGITAGELRGDAWVDVDTLAFEQGKSFTASAFARSDPGSRVTVELAGQFTATVCRLSLR